MNTGAAPILVVAPGDYLLRATAGLALQRYADSEVSLTQLSLVVPTRAMVRPLRETLIRTAAWFGISAVVAGPGTSDFYHPKTVRATMGGLWDVQLETP